MPWDYVAESGQRLFWLYLLSSAMIALLFTGISVVRQQGISIRQYWLHPSALLDYRYFFVSWFIKVFMLAPLLVSAKSVALWTFQLVSVWIPQFDRSLSYEALALLYTISLFVVSDFTRYWLHRWLHTNKWLWQFHKVHHSAPVMNPLTFYRVHPFESFLYGLRYAFSAGIVTGLFMAMFGPRLSLLTLMGTNGLIFIFSILGSNLRHSHIFLGYPAWLERFFISPAQHQVHHYSRYARFNFGGYLGIWDWMFGSLMPSAKAQRSERFGFQAEQMSQYQTIPQLLYAPFVSCYRLIGYYHAKKKTVLNSEPSDGIGEQPSDGLAKSASCPVTGTTVTEIATNTDRRAQP